MNCQSFADPAAVEGANQALNGLSAADRRYATANACACLYLKAGQRNTGLADALLAEEFGALHTALGIADDADGAVGRRFARIIAEFCDPRASEASTSLAAVSFLGRSAEFVVQGEDTEQFARQFRNSLVNLLVTIVGSEGNSHLAMLLFNPYEMLQPAPHGSYPVGFVYGRMPGPEGYHFDCGCKLDEQGRFEDHRGFSNRAPFDNRHLHFVNFCGWAALALGFVLFPENVEHYDRLLTHGFVQEVGWRRQGDSDAESARSFAMNFAKEAFHCIHTVQRLPVDDRALCISELLVRARRQAGADETNPNRRIFATEGDRQAYEETWRQMIDQVTEELPNLRRRAVEVAKAQQELLRLHDFRESLSYMQRFFHNFDLCCMTVPSEPGLEFVSTLLQSREQLKHLRLLGDIVCIQKWIRDRLDGKVPKQCVEQPVLHLIRKRQKVDSSRGHVVDAQHCDVVVAALKRFAAGWQHFWQENDGAIPIECQAGRAEMAGPEAAVERTTLLRVEGKGETLSMNFFLDLDGKCQARLVAEHVTRRANLLVDAACRALSGGPMSAWAEHMRQDLDVWLSDVLLQHHFQALAETEALKNKVLSRLSGIERAAPVLDWRRIQEDILVSHCVHRVQRIHFPEPPPFVFLLEASPEGSKTASGRPVQRLQEESRVQLREKAVSLNPKELQDCRSLVGWACRVVAAPGAASGASLDALALDVPGLRARRECCDAVKELLDGILVGELPGVLECLEEQHGEFALIPSSLKAPLPGGFDLPETFASALAKHRPVLADQDAALREAITELEAASFTGYLDSSDKTMQPLRSTYKEIYLDGSVLLAVCPDKVLGQHLVGVLEALKSCLRQVRRRKAESERGLVWSPEAEGLRHLAIEDAMQAASCESNWWEAPHSDGHPNEQENDADVEDITVAVVVEPKVLLEVFRAVCCGDGRGVQVQTLRMAAEKELAVAKLVQKWSSFEASDFIHLEEDDVRQLATMCGAAAIVKPGAEGGHCHAWMSAYSKVQFVPLVSLLDCQAARECKNQVGNAMLKMQHPHLLGAEVNSDALQCKMPELWERFVYTLGATGCDELEAALAACVVDAKPRIWRHVRDVDEDDLGGPAALLHYDGQYFEVTPRATPSTTTALGQPPLDCGDVPRSELQAVATIQRAWRRRSRQAPAQDEEEQPEKRPKVHGEMQLQAQSLDQQQTQQDKEEAKLEPQFSQSDHLQPAPQHDQSDIGLPDISLWVDCGANSKRGLQHSSLQEPPVQSSAAPEDPPQCQKARLSVPPEVQESCQLDVAPQDSGLHEDTSRVCPSPSPKLTSTASSFELKEAGAKSWFEKLGGFMEKYYSTFETCGYDDLLILQEASEVEIKDLVDACKMLKGHEILFRNNLLKLKVGNVDQTARVAAAATFDEWLQCRGPAALRYKEMMCELGFDELEILRDLDDDDFEELLKKMPRGHQFHFKRGRALLPKESNSSALTGA